MAHDYKIGRPVREDGGTVNVTFRLSKAHYKTLQIHVARAGSSSRSDLIRAALEDAGLLKPPESDTNLS